MNNEKDCMNIKLGHLDFEQYAGKVAGKTSEGVSISECLMNGGDVS